MNNAGAIEKLEAVAEKYRMSTTIHIGDEAAATREALELAIKTLRANETEDVWMPLRQLIGESRCADFMSLGTDVATGTVYLYKHIVTRRYINVDRSGICYELSREAGFVYRPVPTGEAVLRAYEPQAARPERIQAIFPQG